MPLEPSPSTLALSLARSHSLCAPVGLSIYLSSVADLAVPRARASPVIWPPCPALAARPPMPRDALNVRGHVGSCRHSSPCRHSPPPDSPALPAARPEDPLGPPRTPSLARKSLLALLSLSAATPRTAPLRLRERRARQYRYVRAGAAAATVVHWHTWGGRGAPAARKHKPLRGPRYIWAHRGEGARRRRGGWTANQSKGDSGPLPLRCFL